MPAGGRDRVDRLRPQLVGHLPKLLAREVAKVRRDQNTVQKGSRGTTGTAHPGHPAPEHATSATPLKPRLPRSRQAGPLAPSMTESRRRYKRLPARPRRHGRSRPRPPLPTPATGSARQVTRLRGPSVGDADLSHYFAYCGVRAAASARPPCTGERPAPMPGCARDTDIGARPVGVISRSPAPRQRRRRCEAWTFVGQERSPCRQTPAHMAGLPPRRPGRMARTPGQRHPARDVTGTLGIATVITIPGGRPVTRPTGTAGLCRGGAHPAGIPVRAGPPRRM